MLEVAGLSVAYGDVVAVSGVHISVSAGETVALLGPSGSGKTTLLYAIAGFLTPAAGTISLGGRLVASPSTSVPPEGRPVGMVFQHYGLWPHLDAGETVAYPLRRAGASRDDARRRAAELLEQVRIGHLAGRRPAELSGGEQQRVGLARALARRPAVYLLDEPTAHLDVALKDELRSELAARMHADGAAALLATHDVDEALAVADRVVLLRGGAVVQVGRPVEVYEQPADEWAATLTGPASFLAGEGGGRDLVRPEWVRFDGPLDGLVTGVRFRGSHTDYQVATGLGELLLREPGPPRRVTGERTGCRIERRWRMAEPR